MKFTKLYVPTTKEAPKDATLPSHQFLIRAGFVAQIGSGLYNFLPLGKRVLRKVENIVRDEMDKAGANEVALSFVGPGELWKQSRRYFNSEKSFWRLKIEKQRFLPSSDSRRSSSGSSAR